MIREKISHYYWCCRNKLEPLRKNKEFIRFIRLVARFLIILLIIASIFKCIAFASNFLQQHSAAVLLGLIILLLLLEENSGKTQKRKRSKANYTTILGYIKKITALYNGQFNIIKYNIFWSTTCNLILLFTNISVIKMSNEKFISLLVARTLFDPACGNPLHLKEGQYLPSIRCKKSKTNGEQYILRIGLEGFMPEQIKGLAPIISTALAGKVKNYAVTSIQEDEAHNNVKFFIDDVTIDHRLIFSAVEEMRPLSATKLLVDKRHTIDLTTSGSILVAGKTRSGKTTGIIAMLLQVLLCGPDRYGSEVVIIDPKQAELSRLPEVVTVDKDGGGRAILSALKKFAKTITERQAALNKLSGAEGNVVHWWNANMSVSFLFLDEFVSLKAIFPRRSEKDDPDYCLATFDALLKRIVTMGASAGCYVIISIAEASVEEGGLPSMLRSAMTTKILFRPTIPEARLLWSADKLGNLPDRTYQPGDAWFSSTDGVHDEISFVRFPQMNFPVYKELGRLLSDYYSKSRPDGGEA